MSGPDRYGGRYTVLRNLGSNQLETLLARSVGGDAVHVVIKNPLGENAAQFARDAKSAARLEHEHIVRTHELIDDGAALALEFVHGEDAREILGSLSRQKMVIPLGHVLSIGIAAASALHHAHEARDAKGKSLGIVHRTLSPSSIWVGYDGSIKLGDFASVARAGRLGYLAPEQLKGQADRRSDIWGLGVILYELSTQTRLWRGPESDVRAGITSGKVPMPRVRRPDLPNEISMIIMKALSPDPARRFQTAEELRAALASLANGDFAIPQKKMASFMRKLFGEREELWREGAFEARSAGPSTGSGVPNTTGSGSQPRGEWSTSFTRTEMSGQFQRVDLGTRSSSPPGSGPIPVSSPSDTGPLPVDRASRGSRPSRPPTSMGRGTRPSSQPMAPMDAKASDWQIPATPAQSSSKKTFALAIGGIAVVAVAGVIGVTAMGGKDKKKDSAAADVPVKALDPSSTAMPITPAQPAGSATVPTTPTTPAAGAGRDMTVPRPKTNDPKPGDKPANDTTKTDTPEEAQTPIVDGTNVTPTPPPVTPDKPAPPPEEKPAAPVVTTLSQATIDGLAHDHGGELAKCQSSEVHGAITISFDVDASGKVVSSQVNSTVGRAELAACILRSLNKWQFPHPPTGKGHGSYTLAYP